MEVCEKCRPLFEKLLKRIEQLEKENCLIKKRLLMYENAHTPPSLQKMKRIPRITSGKLGAPEGHIKYEREEPKITKTKKYTTKICPCCYSKLGDPKKILRIINEELPDIKNIEVIEHLIDCFKCENCGKEIISENDSSSERFGPNLKAHMTLLKHEDRLPFRKVAATLKRNIGLNFTHVGIMKIIRGVAKKLKKQSIEILK